MKMYSIKADTNYQWLMPQIDEKDLLDLMTFDCEPKSKQWPDIEWFIFNPKRKLGNFFCLGSNGKIAFDEMVFNSDLYSLLEMSGEILPIKLGATNLYILNVLECVNALNDKKTKWAIYEDGTKGRILEYSFYESRLSESPLFKIPETSKAEILTCSHDYDDDFINLYRELGFTGLVFDEIYSSLIE
jgi:hypothetical protein